MPRGDNPNSRKNLKPLQPGLPEKSQRDKQKRASEAGNKAKAEYKDLRDSLRERLTPEKSDEIIDMLVKRTSSGNLKALEIVLKMMGSDESRTREDLLKAQIAKLKTENELLKAQAQGEAEVEDDGFMDALKAETEEVWSDEV